MGMKLMLQGKLLVCSIIVKTPCGSACKLWWMTCQESLSYNGLLFLLLARVQVTS